MKHFPWTHAWIVGAFLMLISGCESAPEEVVASHAQALTAAAWQPGVGYASGELVSYQGKVYRVLQGHGSQLGWEPPNVNALFTYEGEDNGSAPNPLGPSSEEALTLDSVTLRANCDEEPSRCCAPGSTPVSLTTGNDTVASVTANRCILALAGSDTVTLQSSGPSSLLLGPGDDTAMDGAGDDLIWGGPGNDTINGYGGTNLFFGGAGDDTLYAANGTNTVVPGPGRDTVALGTGSDTVYVFDVCEVASGESLDGGSGTDTLIIPVPLTELTALGVTVSNFENVVVEANSCRSECSGRPVCENGVCTEGDEPGDVFCACHGGWHGELCDEFLDTEHASGVPASILATIPADDLTGVRMLSARPPVGHGLLIDRGAPQGTAAASPGGLVLLSGSGAGIGSGTSSATTGQFVVRITSHREGGDGSGFGAETYLVATIDSVGFPRDDSLDDCVAPNCPVLQATVPSNLGTVSVHLKVKEADGGFEGDDDEELDVFLNVNNVTGEWTGSFISDAGDNESFGSDTSCATASDGFGLCWAVEVAGRPKFCPTFRAYYIDSGLGENILGQTGFVEVPAVHAKASVETKRGGIVQGLWEGVLDEEGCVPVGERMLAGNFDGIDKTGQPLTVTTQLVTDFCADPSGANCGLGSNGVAITVQESGAEGPTRLCSVVTEDASLTPPADCALLVDAAPYFSPLGRIPFFATGNTDGTRAAGVVATILARQAVTDDLGVDEGFGNEGVYTIKVNDPCFVEALDKFTSHTDSVEMCLTPPTPGIPSDTLSKFIVAHEFGHAVQRRVSTPLDNSYSFNGRGRWGCDHIDVNHRAHCLQGIELAAAAQGEGYAQYFASRVMNTDDSPTCTFNYYKKVLAPTCLGSECIASGSDYVTSPPLAVSCQTPVKHRNQDPNLVTRAASDPVHLTTGTEWDWMTFFRDVTTGPSAMTNVQLLDVYKAACIGQTFCTASLDGSPVTTGGAPVGSLLNGVEDVFGNPSDEFAAFLSASDRNGVGLDIDP